jgi:hypothetical protein
MKYSRRIFIVITILVILIGLQGPGVLSQGTQPFATMTVSDTVVSGPQRTPTSPGLDSALSQLLDAYEAEGLNAAQALGDQSTMVVEGDQVQVVVVGGSDANMEAIRAAITAAGGELQSSYENFQQAMVSVGALESLASRADVKLVRGPHRPIMLEPEVGAQTTEGVNASGANTWHSLPRRGEGIKVAIIDGGFYGYAALQGTDLPPASRVTTQDYSGTFPGTSEHGTACAEIVYDMAYGVDHMYLVKIDTDVDLASAITYLIGQGVHVISMSLGWVSAEGPGDGTDGGGSSALYDALDDARSNGIFFATAAGNSRENMWSGTFADAGTSPASHDWSGGGQNVNYFGDGVGGAYSIPAGYPIVASLHWDAWSDNQDYDLELYRWTGSGWSFVAGSYNNQMTGADPTEFIGVYAPATTAYGFVVWDYSTTRNCCIRLVTSHNLPRLDEIVTSRTLTFPADSPDAMAVAAVDVTTYAQESYSSQGPRFGPGGTCTGATAVKPDISGYANVSTVSYGAGGFNGTSAATPHVAGAAVLYTGAYSATLGSGSPPTPAQTQTYLENNAMDLGAGGKDTLYGSGRLHLGAPPFIVQATVYLPLVLRNHP